MNFQLIDTGWETVLADAVRKDHSSVRLVCPFIKQQAVEGLLGKYKPDSLQVITRFALDEFALGVSDLAAIRLLMNKGAAIRGVQNLHAKLYLFGNSRAVITSANLTKAALHHNHEFGFVAEDSQIIARCQEYFDDLWTKAGGDLTGTRLAEWEQKVSAYLASGAGQTQPGGLGDEGVNIGLAPALGVFSPTLNEPRQAFVKFFGESNKRAARPSSVLEEVRRSGSHRACTYPKNKRPRNVNDGAIMFLARLVKDPDDIMIYGRAIGMQYVEGRDDATQADLNLRPWKADWPHYVRVHHAEFIAGTLANGVSLNEMMKELKSDAFRSTQQNAAKQEGNTVARRAYLRQPAVELTPRALAWMNERLQRAFNQFGTLPAADLATLDWPDAP